MLNVRTFHAAIWLILFSFNIPRAGKFLEMSEHLKGLTEMYLTFVNPQMRTRAYMALQSLEADLVKMSQVFR